MRKIALAFTLACTAALPAVAGSAGKFDGNWSVSIVTDKGDCDGYKWTLIVAGDKLQKVDGMPIAASGGIDGSGQARFQVASIVTANGKMQGAAGSGAWSAPSRSCSGRWQAARL